MLHVEVTCVFSFEWILGSLVNVELIMLYVNGMFLLHYVDNHLILISIDSLTLYRVNVFVGSVSNRFDLLYSQEFFTQQQS